MPERTIPISSVALRDTVLRYQFQEDAQSRRIRGWGAYDVMAELVGEMAEWVAGSAAEDYKGMIPSWWHSGATRLEPSVLFASDPVNAIIPAMWHDYTQRFDLTAFDLTDPSPPYGNFGDFKDNWCDYVTDFNGASVNIMFNSVPPLLGGTIGYTGMRSRFALPQNPMFAINLWRGAPGQDVTTANRREMKTGIRFGIQTQGLIDKYDKQMDSWERKIEIWVQLPYDGHIRVWWRAMSGGTTGWEAMQGEERTIDWAGSVATGGKMPNAQYATIYIGCIRGGIAVSTDRFNNSIAYFTFPDVQMRGTRQLQPVERKDGGPMPVVPQGFMELEHNAGMWAFSFFPLTALDADGNFAKLWGPLHDAGYSRGYTTGTPPNEVFYPYHNAEEKIYQGRVAGKRQPRVIDTEDDDYRDPNDKTVDATIEVSEASANPDFANRATDATKTDREWHALFRPAEWQYTYNHRYAQCSMQRYQAVGEDPLGLRVAFNTHVPPELYAVNSAEWPLLETVSSPAETNISHLVHSITYAAPLDEAQARCDIVLDNTMAELRELRLQGAREIVVGLGYELDDDSTEMTNLITGVVREPVAEESVLSSATLTIQAPDFVTLLNRNVADGRLPSFDGWHVWKVFWFLLRRAGFDDSEMGVIVTDGHFTIDMTDVTQGLEDTRKYLSVGPPEENLAQPDAEVPLRSYLANLAEYNYDGILWMSPDGIVTTSCRHCRRRRDGSQDPSHNTHPARHTDDDGPNSFGCQAYDDVRAPTVPGIDHELYSPASELVSAGVPFFGQEILSIRVWNTQMDRRRFANRVQVTVPLWISATGFSRRQRGATARPISAVREDKASITDPLATNYAHGEVMYNHRGEPWLVGQADVNRRTRELLARFSNTTEFIEVELPFNPQIAKGHVFRVHGGDISLDVRDHVYRVLFVDHRLPSPGTARCRTHIGGVYLRTEIAA